MKNPKIERILEISKKLGLAHIGSCISVLPILEEIYSKKKPEDKVILDNAHAHLAHLVVREHEGEIDFKNVGTIEDYITKFGIHCDRRAGCDSSGGSLSHTGISIGLCIANRDRKVYLIVSDGSVCEGSFAESLRIAKMLNITNLEIHANFNSYTAVQKIDVSYFEQFIAGFGFPVIFHHTSNSKEFESVEGHYKKIT